MKAHSRENEERTLAELIGHDFDAQVLGQLEPDSLARVDWTMVEVSDDTALQVLKRVFEVDQDQGFNLWKRLGLRRIPLTKICEKPKVEWAREIWSIAPREAASRRKELLQQGGEPDEIRQWVEEASKRAPRAEVIELYDSIGSDNDELKLRLRPRIERFMRKEKLSEELEALN